MNAYLEGQTHVKSLIDADEACRMASDWLRAMEIDVEKLNRERKSKVEQLQWMLRDPIPWFTVTWDNGGRMLGNGQPSSIPAISILIDGEKCCLVDLMIEDEIYSNRPAELIKNIGDLLMISNDQFSAYDTFQKSDLVSNFAAVRYDPT